MMAFSDFTSEVEALSKLLQHTEVVQDDVVRPHEVSKPTPASIGPKDLLAVKVAAPRAWDKNDIWTEEEAECSGFHDEVDDGREVPRHDFKYKQAVSTADNFLGLSGKDPSSRCCEELVVAVQLPDAASAAEIELDVTATHLRMSSPRYKLSLHLPHKVNCDRGTAKWDSKKKMLNITLPIVQEDL